MSKLLTFIVLSLLCSSTWAQKYDYSIGQQTEKIDSFQQYLQEFENLGVKSTGSSELNAAKDWIVSTYNGFGYTASLDSFDNFNSKLYNIIIEKPGLDTNKWIIIGAHYDTREGTGTNDNGSGVVACMEIARIMKDISTKVGVRFIHFTGEENGYLGSIHYVNQTLSPNEEIQLMLNLDQLGGTKGDEFKQDNQRIYTEYDNGNNVRANDELSKRKTDTLASLVYLYSNLEPVGGSAYASDYMPFENAGYVITGLYQYSDYPFYHSERDSMVNMDLESLHEVIKGALAAAMHFSRNLLSLAVPTINSNEVLIYPNPASKAFMVDQPFEGSILLVLYDKLGSIVYKKEIRSGEWLDISELPNGLYSVRISTNSNSKIYHSKLIIAAD